MRKINKELKQVGSIKDRGAMKWQGMFLTEHVEMLKQWREEDNLVPEPKLDEYDLQLINEEMDLAFKRQCIVILHTWKAGKVTRHFGGKIISIDIKSRVLIYEDPFKQYRLSVDEIVSVNMQE